MGTSPREPSGRLAATCNRFRADRAPGRNSSRVKKVDRRRVTARRSRGMHARSRPPLLLRRAALSGLQTRRGHRRRYRRDCRPLSNHERRPSRVRRCPCSLGSEPESLQRALPQGLSSQAPRCLEAEIEPLVSAAVEPLCSRFVGHATPGPGSRRQCREDAQPVPASTKAVGLLSASESLAQQSQVLVQGAQRR